MKFRIPTEGTEFEIPDDWWSFADMGNFSPNRGRYYPYSQTGCETDIEIVPIDEIGPPTRNLGVGLFKKYKMLPVLFAFQSPECDLPPIRLIRSAIGARFSFSVQNGFHRYYASVAAGYSHVPATIAMQSD